MYYCTRLKSSKLKMMRKVAAVAVCTSITATSTISLALTPKSTSVQINDLSNEDDEESSNTGEFVFTMPLPLQKKDNSNFSNLLLLEPFSKEVYSEDIEVTKVEEEVVENKPKVIETKPLRSNTLYKVIEDGNVAKLDIIYQDYLWEMCNKYNVTEYYELLLAQMYHESKFDSTIISKTNDYGLMQINKCNHKWLSKELGSNDFLDPYLNIESGVLMMSMLLDKYNDVQKALVCYNMGESAVKNGTYTTKYSKEVLSDMDLLVVIQE